MVGEPADQRADLLVADRLVGGALEVDGPTHRDSPSRSARVSEIGTRTAERREQVRPMTPLYIH